MLVVVVESANFCSLECRRQQLNSQLEDVEEVVKQDSFRQSGRSEGGYYYSKADIMKYLLWLTLAITVYECLWYQSFQSTLSRKERHNQRGNRVLQLVGASAHCCNSCNVAHLAFTTSCKRKRNDLMSVDKCVYTHIHMNIYENRGK